MNKRLINFYYSQNSINTYKSCPLKFKYKYIDKLNWKKDDIGSREYYDSLVIGRNFHLICERYFSNIPVGTINEEKFKIWMERIKKLLPLNIENIYLPEYEVRFKLNDNIIIAKYDLVVISEDSIEIWDWKTENKKIDAKNIENRMQTIIYMMLAKEVIPKLLDKKIDTSNITMKYYQPQFEEKPIAIYYNEDKHKSNKLKIENFIELIKNTKYEIDDLDCSIELIKNKNHCKFCEFNKLCNNEKVDYKILEEDEYEY